MTHPLACTLGRMLAYGLGHMFGWAAPPNLGPWYTCWASLGMCDSAAAGSTRAEFPAVGERQLFGKPRRRQLNYYGQWLNESITKMMQQLPSDIAAVMSSCTSCDICLSPVFYACHSLKRQPQGGLR